MHFDATLLARVLLTLVTLGYGLATIFADFNKTHAINPKWTGHARFHVVWQISSYAGFGDDNGYQPFAAPIPIVAKRWDVNITAFSIQLALLAAGSLAIIVAAG
jgi:hypothetical protein